MSAHNVNCLLDHNTAMHKDSKFYNARICWNLDKKYVMEYKVNPNRFLITTKDTNQTNQLKVDQSTIC